jgi:hypothetical protein
MRKVSLDVALCPDKNINDVSEEGHNLYIFIILRTDRVISTPASYSGDSGFKSRPRDMLS